MNEKNNHWGKGTLTRILRRYKGYRIFRCVSRGSDAIAVEKDGEIVVIKGSLAAPRNDSFDKIKNSIQDYRRIAEKFGNLDSNRFFAIRIAFSSLTSAAQFVTGSQSSKASVWKPI